MEWILIGVFLLIEGINRMGYRFNGDEVLKGVLLFLAGAFMVFFNL